MTAYSQLERRSICQLPVLLLLFFVCFSFQIGAQSGSASDQVILQLSWKHQFQFAGYYMAKEKGYYRDAGLEVEIREITQGSSATDIVLAGDAHFGINRSGLVLERMNGKKITLLSAILQHSPFVAIAKERDDLQTVADIKGKRFMTVPGRASLGAITSMLRFNGIYEDDYIKLDNNFSVDDLLEGRIDLMTGYISTQLYEIKQSGVPYRIFSPRDYGFDFYNDILFTSEELYAQDPELVERFRTASLSGWEYAFSHIEETARLIHDHYNTRQLTLDALIYEGKTNREMAFDPGVPLGYINLDRIGQIAVSYQLLNLTENALPQDDAFVVPQSLVLQMASLTDEERRWLDNHPYIRVGTINDFSPFQYTDGNGNVVGIAEDILKETAVRTGIDIRSNPGTWRDSLTALKDNKLDLLSVAVKTPQLEKYLAFTRPFLTVPHALVLPRNSIISSGSDLAGKKMALERERYTIDLVKESLPKVEIYEVDTTLDALLAVFTGEADCYLGNLSQITTLIENNNLPGIKALAFNEVESLEIRMAVRREWTPLISILEKGLELLTNDQRREITSKYIDFGGNSPFSLSEDETAWLEENKNFKVAVFPKWPPFEFVDENDNYSGITSEYFKVLEEKIGFQFEYSWHHTWAETLTAARNGEIDIIASIMKLEERESTLNFTIPYLSTNQVIITQENSFHIYDTLDALIGKKMAVVKGYAVTDLLHQDYPNIDYIIFDTAEEALQAVADGRVEATVEISAVFFYLARQLNLKDDLEISGFIPYGYDLSIGVRKDLPPQLVTILDKALKSISEQEEGIFRERWINNQLRQETNWRAVWQIILVTVLIASSIVVIFIYANRKLRRDITERKLLEKELVEAKEDAEAAAKAKGDFLANMSHEIRTPMNAVVGLAQLALMTELTGKQRDYIQKIESSGQSLLGIINDILDFSKIDSGMLIIEQNPFNLDEVLNHVFRLNEQKCQDKGIALLLDRSPDIPVTLVGDSLRLGQIILNFLSNAIKFTEKGKIILQLKVLERMEDKIHLVISIKDTGIGIPKEKLESLFSAFTQADISTTRKYGGTGLGLSISRNLVALMGGAVRVESTPGVGSTFFATLPFGIVDENPIDSTTLAGKAPENFHVLIVDDNESSRQILQNYLRSFRFQITLCASAEEAISELRNNQEYDLVLMDWKMPQLDGITTAANIVSDPEIKSKPNVILVTAYSREEALEAARLAGVELDGLLIKPVTPSLLFDTIQNAQNKQRKEVAYTVDSSLRRFKKNHSVLLVEDNEINRQVARELLNVIGMDVSEAVDGAVAVELLKEERYEVILMDVQMPVMDGYAATRHIREMGISTPIVAMTANAMIGDREKALEAGMDDHVSKPIDREVLWKALEHWLGYPESEV